jgi:hypothetical protein
MGTGDSLWRLRRSDHGKQRPRHRHRAATATRCQDAEHDSYIPIGTMSSNACVPHRERTRGDQPIEHVEDGAVAEFEGEPDRTELEPAGVVASADRQPASNGLRPRWPLLASAVITLRSRCKLGSLT